MNDTIKYLSGGLIGDFIYQLSIINENYLLTGKKGDLYLVDKLYNIKREQFKEISCWRFGVEKAYNDLKNIILEQDYINDFKIYNNEKFDYIYLSSWYDSSLLFNYNFYEIFKKEYNVEWASHKWLNLPLNKMFDDIILVSTSQRYNESFDFEKIHNYNKKIFYATTDIKEYEFFKKKSQVKFDLILFNNILDFWIAINSCFLFISNLSSFLCVAHALHKNHIAILPYNDENLIKKDMINMKWYINNCEHNLQDTPLSLDIEDFDFTYSKDENKITIYTPKKIDNAKIIIYQENEIIYETISSFNNNRLWYKPNRNIFEKNNIKIKIIDKNNNLLKENFIKN